MSPAEVSLLSCSPATVSSGNSTICTVTLVNAAPGGGANVSLLSDNFRYYNPPSVPGLGGPDA
jgi:hypothetical protein